MEVIEHVADERQTLGELARLLRPGGVLILTTPHKAGSRGLILATSSLHSEGRTGCFTGLRQSELRCAFGAARQQQVGLISDISANQEHPWHRHYKYSEIRALAILHSKRK